MTPLYVQESEVSPLKMCLEVVVPVSVSRVGVHVHQHSSLSPVQLHSIFVIGKLFVE
jgi:hypothetical protein